MLRDLKSVSQDEVCRKRKSTLLHTREECGQVTLQEPAGVLVHCPVTGRKQWEIKNRRHRANHDDVNCTEALSLLLRETGLHRSILSKRMGVSKFRQRLVIFFLNIQIVKKKKLRKSICLKYYFFETTVLTL